MPYSAEQQRQWRIAHPAAQREATTRWRAKNPEKVKAKKRRAHARMSDEKKQQERERLRKFRADNYDRLLIKSRHKKQKLPLPSRACPDNCELCGRPAWLEIRAFALDHNHSTGKFRGWLCWHCNTALGLLGDSREGLEKAIAYLDRADGS